MPKGELKPKGLSEIKQTFTIVTVVALALLGLSLCRPLAQPSHQILAPTPISFTYAELPSELDSGLEVQAQTYGGYCMVVNPNADPGPGTARTPLEARTKLARRFKKPGQEFLVNVWDRVNGAWSLIIGAAKANDLEDLSVQSGSQACPIGVNPGIVDP